MTRKIIQEIISVLLRIAFVVVLVVVAYKCTSICYNFGYRIFADEAKDPAPGITKTVAIVDGKSDKEIGDILKEKGLIDNSILFAVQVKFSEYDEKLEPGVYELSTAMSPYEMMAVMSNEQEMTAPGEGDVDEVYTKDQATLWDEADDVIGSEDEPIEIIEE